MDKKTIVWIAVLAIVFAGFAYRLSQDQRKYEEEMAAWQAYVNDSLAAAAASGIPEAEAAETAGTFGEGTEMSELPDSAASVQAPRPAPMGALLAEARDAAAEVFTVENDVMALRFSTRGGRIEGVTLKEYTKYAPRDERTQLVELFAPESSGFALTFYLRSGLNDVDINTMDYTFRAEPVRTTPEGAQSVVMRLPVAEDAWLEYEYLIYNERTPQRDYLVDFDVRLVNMASKMANQTVLGIDWRNTSYRNERGFKNENKYTTVAWRFPGDSSIEELSVSEMVKSEQVSTAVNWVAFKQQFFSSIFIAPENFSRADLFYATAVPGSEFLKSFEAELAVPYTPQTESYDFAFYFGPNKYSILRKVEVDGERLSLDRLIPMGWVGWINRWCVIPVFDFLRKYIDNFGIIIIILAVLIRLVISPLTYKSYVSMAKMRLVKPQLDELAKKYPRQEDAMKRNQATMELYKKAGINPMGGCIPMLIQMPILVAVFYFLPTSIELRGESFLWSQDLSAYDSILELPFSIWGYGDHVSLFALLMCLSTFAYSYYNYQQTASSQPQMASMKFMMVYMMPLMLLFWFNDYASGLCFYYLISNLLTIGQTLLIRRMVDDTKIQAIMDANAARKSNGKKSKFQQRYEELLRQQEAQQRSRKK